MLKSMLKELKKSSIKYDFTQMDFNYLNKPINASLEQTEAKINSNKRLYADEIEQVSSTPLH